MRLLQVLTCAVCAAALLCAAPLRAAPLPAGATLYPPNPPTLGEPEPSGLAVVVAGPLVFPFVAAPLYSGVLTSTVYSDPGNALGGLTFVYELSNDFVSLDAIHRLTINDFAGFTVDASYQTPTVNLAPTLITRSAAGTVGFAYFGFPVGPGDITNGVITARMVLETDAPVAVSTLASVINGTVASVPSYAPAPVPEPTGIVLMLIGASALAAYAIRWRAGVG